MREQEVRQPARERPESEHLGQVPAHEHTGRGEEKQGDQCVKPSRARLGAAHQLVPADRRDHANLDHQERDDGQVIDVKNEVDRKGLKVGRS